MNDLEERLGELYKRAHEIEAKLAAVPDVKPEAVQLARDEQSVSNAPMYPPFPVYNPDHIILFDVPNPGVVYSSPAPSKPEPETVYFNRTFVPWDLAESELVGSGLSPRLKQLLRTEQLLSGWSRNAIPRQPPIHVAPIAVSPPSLEPTNPSNVSWAEKMALFDKTWADQIDFYRQSIESTYQSLHVSVGSGNDSWAKQMASQSDSRFTYVPVPAFDPNGEWWVAVHESGREGVARYIPPPSYVEPSQSHNVHWHSVRKIITVAAFVLAGITGSCYILNQMSSQRTQQSGTSTSVNPTSVNIVPSCTGAASYVTVDNGHVLTQIPCKKVLGAETIPDSVHPETSSYSTKHAGVTR